MEFITFFSEKQKINFLISPCFNVMKRGFMTLTNLEKCVFVKVFYLDGLIWPSIAIFSNVQKASREYLIFK